MTINSTTRNSRAVSSNYVLVSSTELEAAIEKHAALQAKMQGIKQTALYPETCSVKKSVAIEKPAHRHFSFSHKSGKYSFGNPERKSTDVDPLQVTPMSTNSVVRKYVREFLPCYKGKYSLKQPAEVIRNATKNRGVPPFPVTPIAISDVIKNVCAVKKNTK